MGLNNSTTQVAGNNSHKLCKELPSLGNSAAKPRCREKQGFLCDTSDSLKYKPNTSEISSSISCTSFVSFSFNSSFGTP